MCCKGRTLTENKEQKPETKSLIMKKEHCFLPIEMYQKNLQMKMGQDFSTYKYQSKKNFSVCKEVFLVNFYS